MGYELYELYETKPPESNSTKVFALLSTISMSVPIISTEPQVRAKMQTMGLNPDLWFKEPIPISVSDWNAWMEAIKC